MKENFGKNYFYGFKESNYINYEKLNPKKLFKGITFFIRNQNIKGGRILDVGCAFGFLLREFSSNFDELYGFDVSEFAINKAKKVIPRADLRISDLEGTLPYPDNFFDCIVAVDVLEHTKNFEKSLEKIVKKLKKGGYLIVSTPISEWPRRFFGFLDRDKTHISVLKEEELNKIIKKNKLSVLKKRYYSPFPIIYRIPYIPYSIEILLIK